MKKFISFIFILISFAIYIWWQNMQELNKWENLFKTSQFPQITLKGRLTRQPYQRYSKDIIILDGIYISTDIFSGYHLGDKVAVSGTLEKRLIEKNNFQFWLIEPTIDLISPAKNEPFYSQWNILYRLGNFSTQLVIIAKSALPEPHSSLLAGILLGIRSNMPENFYNKLVTSGTLHVIAASGFNITIVAKVLINSLTNFISRRRALPLAFAGIVIYTILAGASEAVVRAAIMGSLAYIAQALGRDYTAKWALLISAIVMLLFKPTLIASVSFQLSVAATAGILWLEPIISQRFLNFIKTKKGILASLKTDFSTTIAASFAVLPISLVTFGQLSLVSPFSNLTILWLIPPIMFIGAVLVSIGLVSPFLAKLVGIISWPLLELFIRLVDWWGSLPFSSVEVNGLNWLFGLGYYLILICIVNILSRTSRK
jgi:competence protein ComEC